MAIFGVDDVLEVRNPRKLLDIFQNRTKRKLEQDW